MKQELEHLKDNLFVPFVFVLILWIVQVVQVLFNIDLGYYGVLPRTQYGLQGILFYPFIHGDWGHLFSNSIPVFVLLFILLTTYRTIAWRVWILIWLLSGVGIWLFGRENFHIGASGLIYGLAFFIFFSGIFRRDLKSMAVALLVAFLYGGIVWGLLPLQEGVSFEGHITGAVAGMLCAYYYRSVNLPPKKQWNEPDPYAPHIERQFWVREKNEEAL